MNEPITPELIRSEAASLRHTGRGNYADFMELVAAHVQKLEEEANQLAADSAFHKSSAIKATGDYFAATAKLAQYDAACEAMAMRVLGQERYDNSACQAHPMELIEIRVKELQAELEKRDV